MTTRRTEEIGDGVTLYLGDCLDVMRELPENSVDSIVTDPPYGLSFMGKDWDHGVPGVEFWVEALRVAKPGAHLLAFGGTRTFHRLACAIEDAGWELRDSIGVPHKSGDWGDCPWLLAWVYGSGFPKSKNVALAIDKKKGLPNRGHRIATASRRHPDGTLEPNGESIPAYEGKTDESRPWSGFGTALKPAWEPIVVARKPLDGTVAQNVLKHGTGGLNIDGCRIGTEKVTINTWDDGAKPFGGGAGHKYSSKQVEGRWPANLVHDGSEEVLKLFPETTSGKQAAGGHVRNSDKHRNTYASFKGQKCEGDVLYGDSGSAARFFFQAKQDKDELLFCRAKDILSAWKLVKGEQPCSPEDVSSVESSSSLSRQAAVSVLSDAVIVGSQGDRLLSDARGLSTTVTEKECETLCETLITAMLISENVALPALSQDALTPNGCRVNIAAIQKPTDIMTITISRPILGGFAAPVTFSITPSCLAHGVKDLGANRLVYCAKADSVERHEGVGHPGKQFKHGVTLQKVSKTETKGNNHPTVKPVDLMKYLCRLVTPPGGIVLDPFMGSGSTGKAAAEEGFRFLGIDMGEEEFEIAVGRVRFAYAMVGWPGAEMEIDI